MARESGIDSVAWVVRAPARQRVPRVNDVVVVVRDRRGAGRGSRTPTPSRAPDFESGASTSSATSALPGS
jgi:hypothetical protein